MKKILLITIIAVMTVLLAANQPPQSRQLRHKDTDSTESQQCYQKPQRQRLMQRIGNQRDFIPQILNELELTDKQKEQIETLMFDNRLLMTDLNADLKKLALQKDKYMSEANFQDAKIKLKEFHNKKAEIESKHIELIENIFKILDKEQQEKCKNLQRNCGGGNICPR